MNTKHSTISRIKYAPTNIWGSQRPPLIKNLKINTNGLKRIEKRLHSGNKWKKNPVSQKWRMSNNNKLNKKYKNELNGKCIKAHWKKTRQTIEKMEVNEEEKTVVKWKKKKKKKQ